MNFIRPDLFHVFYATLSVERDNGDEKKRFYFFNNREHYPVEVYYLLIVEFDCYWSVAVTSAPSRPLVGERCNLTSGEKKRREYLRRPLSALLPFPAAGKSTGDASQTSVSQLLAPLGFRIPFSVYFASRASSEPFDLFISILLNGAIKRSCNIHSILCVNICIIRLELGKRSLYN